MGITVKKTQIIDKLPVGIEDFEEIRTQGFYYVDKTGMIIDLLYNWGKVNLFTRPRRFGKSLNMSMLKNFFEINCNKSLFQGLKISKDKALCDKYMGQFPVISVSLKGVSGRDFSSARAMLISQIKREAQRFQFLVNSDKLTVIDKETYLQLASVENLDEPMTDMILTEGILNLSILLQKHYGRKVIILIDEYDVPLEKAYQFGYYDEMANLIRNIFLQTLKSNDSLYFAVLTGCLRISKERIFTGLNNPKVLSITNVRFDECFGFTDQEVQELLDFYGLTEHYNEIKEWYDGYQFGGVNVYCPWDVISYCDDLCSNPEIKPQDYWSNTSSNEIVKRLLKKATSITRREIEQLINGDSIKKVLYQELTYKDLDSSIDNLWSMLFTTGYLTQCSKPVDDSFELCIPNKEIKKIFITQIKEWFEDAVLSDKGKLSAFGCAFRDGNAQAVEEQFNAYLMKTISIRDTNVRKEKKENFYHGILLGSLAHMENWGISSNAESGEGYSDILVELEDGRIGIVVEIKYAEKGELEKWCQKALQQINDNRYAEALLENGMETILKYGIACYKKRCRVVLDNS